MHRICFILSKDEDGFRLFEAEPHIHNSYAWEEFAARDGETEKGIPIPSRAVELMTNFYGCELPTWENDRCLVFESDISIYNTKDNFLSDEVQ